MSNSARRPIAYARRDHIRFTQATLVRTLTACAALGYGYVVSILVFARLEADPGTDVHVYASLHNRYSLYIESLIEGLADYVLREVHFHYWYEWLSDHLGDPYFALQVIAFASATITFFYCTDSTLKRLALSLLILSHPRALDLLGGAQRMGAALAVFLVATKIERLPIRYALFVLAISFHTYAAVLVCAFLLYEFLLKNPTAKSKIISIVASVVIVLVTVVLREYILSELGDRRASIESDTTGVLYTVMWVLTGIAIHFLAPRLIFTPYGAMFYMLLLSVPAAVALGLYAERYIALAIVMLAASNIAMKPAQLLAFLGVYSLNLGLSFYYWL